MLQAINCNKAFDTKLFLKMPPNTSTVSLLSDMNTCLIFVDIPKNMTADTHQLPLRLLSNPGSFYHSIQRHLSSRDADTNAAKRQSK